MYKFYNSLKEVVKESRSIERTEEILREIKGWDNRDRENMLNKLEILEGELTLTINFIKSKLEI